jgi:hypothetical protein
LTVDGSSFVVGSVVQWNGSNRTTTYVSATRLTAAILATDIATAGTTAVTVSNPSPGGGISNAQAFTINNPAPATTSISPTSGTAGGAAFTLTVNGTNVRAGSVVQWNGLNRTTTYVSTTRVTAAIPAADIAAAGTASVTVSNPAPGGGISNALTFTINNPVPTTTGRSPSSAIAGGSGFTLTVNGTNFRASSIVRWNGADRTTTYVSTTQLTAAISAADIASAGTIAVTVFNPAPGGGTSGSQTFTINNPVPTTTSISPTSTTAGGSDFVLTISGSGFVPTSTVRWSGINQPTTYVNANQLTAIIGANDIASGAVRTVTVNNPTPGGGTSNSQTFTVNNPLPSIGTISPTSARAGGTAFTLTVNGSGFVPTSRVRWNGSNRTTTFVSSVQVTAAITATDIAIARTRNITVNNPTPSGGTSNTVIFTVSP